MRVGQALKQEHIHQRENCCVSTDGERQGEDYRESEAGILVKLPGTETKIADPGVQRIAKPLFANLLFDLFGATEFHARGTVRFPERHSRAKIFVNQKLEV